MEPVQTTPSRRYPLGMPRGSIRALLALSVFGSLMATLILNRNIPEATFWYLWMVNYAVLGYYFASRQKNEQTPTHNHTPQPLNLPRGTVRWLLLLSFLGTCGYFVFKWINGNGAIWEDKAFFPMLSLAGFFLGRLFHHYYQSRQDSPSKLLHRINDLKAILVLLCGTIIVLTIPLSFELPAHQDLQRFAFLFIFFYFGSRS